ncbi:NAD(FAD)-utilizing dehydrogenase [Paenibacillus koleovorans]|uniref:NAD(FAD)-utilizing dehydrogenase n=1 Tax=Paenibacillus koleovorans TaxID=121608 RepID=UPI000FD814A1|nr:NAD(FAD)-utilizing dehydrogenase [Paenibacillus koleovorans]
MYDFITIGSGVSSIFMAYAMRNSGRSVLILEKGKPLEARSCPLDRGESCDCEACDKFFGFAGLGKSEGKFNYTSDFGGELEHKLGKKRLHELMREVDDILCSYGGDAVDMYSTVNPQLARKAEQSGLKLLSTEVRHLGSTLSSAIFQRIYEEIVASDSIQLQFQVDVQTIQKDADGFFTVHTSQGSVRARQIAIATGRSGTDWLNRQAAELGVRQGKTRLDLGFRVEMKEQQLRAILQNTFETKLSYADENTVSTTYCMNPRGSIIRKYQEGLVMPDGQNFRERQDGTTANLNFTLFTPAYFSTLEEANQLARQVIGGINRGGERIVVQRLEDLRRGRPTTTEQLTGNRIQPTLHADAGYLPEEIPAPYIPILLRFLERLEHFLEEPLDEDTLLYGMDGKFYAPVLETDERFQTAVPGFYLIGDCSGVTHSLSQAAACGLYLGKLLSSDSERT